MDKNVVATPSDVAIDSSSLNGLLSKPSVSERFVSRILQHGQRVVLPDHVVAEILAGKDRQAIIDRAKGMGRLWTALGESRMRISKPFHEIAQQELIVNTRETPVENQNVQNIAHKAFTSFGTYKDLKELLGITDEIQRRKLDHYRSEPDRTAKDQDEMRKSPKAVREWIAKVEGYKNVGDIYSDALLREAVSKLVRPVGPEPQVTQHLQWIIDTVKSRQKFHALRIFLALYELTAVGVTLTGFSETETETVKLFQREKNIWYDNVILAESAYASVVLVDDHRSRDRAKYLAARGLATFQSLSLSEFLSPIRL